MIDKFLNYFEKAKKMQELKFEGGSWTEQDINDDLVWNIPIYDVVNRKYAAFSSLLEAIVKKDKDPKGNGIYFQDLEIADDDFINLCYFFRLCGSGINYIPKTDQPWNTHGFGNFWIVDLLRDFTNDTQSWLELIPNDKFCDVKGYLLPMIKGGLRNYIVNDSMYLLDHIKNKIYSSSFNSIKEVVDTGNDYLVSKGFKRQNFVLTAFAMDLAEYYPHLVDRNSDVYVGTNAKKCLDQILPKMNKDKALRYLCDITGNYNKPYDMEDVACDFIRYMENFQSPDHIKMNNGVIYKNNVSE